MIDKKVGDAYHKAWYESKVWHSGTTWMGIPVQKSGMDLVVYQELIWNIKPSLILEFGCWRGGSSAFFLTMAEMLFHAGRSCTVVSVDVDPQIDDNYVMFHPRHELLKGSSTDVRVTMMLKGFRDTDGNPMFAILDSEHSRQHVLAELEVIRPGTRAGDVVVVEDTNLNGHPVYEGFGGAEGGPWEAVDAYFEKYPSDYAHMTEYEEKFAFSQANHGILRRL
jgi:cephalosporin hydroxylase